MTKVLGVKPILKFLTDFISWFLGITSLDSPIQQFANAILNDSLIFIFVVIVPLVGLGIGLLNRLIKAN